jgi:hypothetical protein
MTTKRPRAIAQTCNTSWIGRRSGTASRRTAEGTIGTTRTYRCSDDDSTTENDVGPSAGLIAHEFETEYS